jgi:hypothetical protein
MVRPINLTITTFKEGGFLWLNKILTFVDINLSIMKYILKEGTIFSNLSGKRIPYDYPE